MSRLDHWLRGVRVLNLSGYRLGPFANPLLADFGAEVFPPLTDAEPPVLRLPLTCSGVTLWA